MYIIDVSQAVEHDHPHALEFLRKDCTNVNGAQSCPQEGGGDDGLGVSDSPSPVAQISF